jgi:NRPS condensation-like uncharacterized protein
MHRQLGANEHVIWSYAQIRPVHFTITANIIGRLHREELQLALVKVQQRHPLLNMRIVLDKSGIPWLKKESVEIPIRVVARHSKEQWQQEVEQELGNPFDSNQAPLIRIILLEGDDISDLIITCDHAIADGKSAVFLLKDILQAIGLPGQPLPALAEHHSYEKLVSEKSIKETSFEPLLSTTKTKPVLPEKSRPRLHAWSLSKTETIALIDKCKKKQVSVHGTICAAFLLAMSEDNSSSETLKCLSPVDVRRFLPVIDEDFGFYFTMIVTANTVTSNLSLWELARQVKDQLNQKIAPEQVFAHFPEVEAFVSNLTGHEDAVKMIETVNENDILVTNLGRLTIPQQYGELQLAAVYGPSLMTHMDQDLVAGITTLNDQMFFSLVYSEFNISNSQIEELQQKAMELLLT